MLKQFIDALSSIGTLCITLQRNQVGACCLVALSGIALAGYALYVVSTR
ncbi:MULTISPECIES: hypothetical protein [unclassified Burkholderia]|nr:MULTISPECIES: hypothetical protein [unclassified Burkholderia]